MDKKAFYRWLDEATDAELAARRDAVAAVLPKLIKEEDAHFKARGIIKEIEAEMLSRAFK